MQLMSWSMARLGSRFNLLFEPCQKRVMHSALGRFLDEPVDLAVGLIEPDGTERVLPFTTRGKGLFNCEQFERMNSITYRGFSEDYLLRFEFNIHSTFYPQNEKLCIMPAFYLEMRVNPIDRVRWTKAKGPRPDKVRLFIRLQRPDTRITATAAEGEHGPRLDLAYRTLLKPFTTHPTKEQLVQFADHPSVEVRERIISLNTGAVPDADGQGLSVEIPVSEEGSGIKWRLVWGAHVQEPVLQIATGQSVPTSDAAASGQTQKPGDKVPATTPAKFLYTRYWNNIDSLMKDAVRQRDDLLGHSRRFEKLIEQSPINGAQAHLLHHSFQNYLLNTFWCAYGETEEWYSVWEGNCLFHSTVDVEYNVCLFYLTLWPQLLAMQVKEWPMVGKPHAESNGTFLSHDMGVGLRVGSQAYPHDMPVEENCNYLLMLQAYSHWTGDTSLIQPLSEFVAALARYLIWTDRDGSGFPSHGTANTIDDASPAVQYARRQTYLAVKRVAALRAAADLLTRAQQSELAQKCKATAQEATAKIEAAAWLGDHYAVCIDRTTEDVVDAWTGQPLPYDTLGGWDAFSIYTANGLLLPLMIDQRHPFDGQRIVADLVNAARETLGRYGCGHTSSETENVWISQNLWRDHTGIYLGAKLPAFNQYYWDLELMSNTHEQSLGFIDTYINNNLSHYPRGITSIGWFTAEPRLIMDRLAEDGPRITVEPDTHRPQRWPLLALADWKAGKIPVCVVDGRGKVTIEGKIDRVVIRAGGAAPAPENDAPPVIG